MPSPSLRDRTCIWCGGRAEYRCLIQRARERSFRHAVRYELCAEHVRETLDRLEMLIAPTDQYLISELVPPRPQPTGLPVAAAL